MRLPYISRRLLPAALLAIILAACGTPAGTATPTDLPLPTNVAEPTPMPATAVPEQPTQVPATPKPEPTAQPEPTAVVATDVLPAPLYYLAGGPGAPPQIFRIERDGVKSTQITNEKPPTPDALPITEFDVSPRDGALAYIIQGQAGNSLIQTDKNGQNRIVLLENLSVSNPRWSPDGSRVAVQVYREPAATDGLAGGVYFIPAGGGEPELIQANDTLADPNQPDPTARMYVPGEWSPNGNQITLNACAYASEFCELMVKTLGSDTLTKIQAPENMTSSVGKWSADGSRLYVTMIQPGSIAATVGLWRADPATGDVAPFVPAKSADDKLNVVTGTHAGQDGSVYAFLTTVEALPDPFAEPPAKWPAFSMARVSSDAARADTLRDDSAVTPGDTVLWANDDSGVLVGEGYNERGELTGLSWLPADGGAPVNVPVGSMSIRWGVQ